MRQGTISIQLSGGGALCFRETVPSGNAYAVECGASFQGSELSNPNGTKVATMTMPPGKYVLMVSFIALDITAPNSFSACQLNLTGPQGGYGAYTQDVPASVGRATLFAAGQNVTGAELYCWISAGTAYADADMVAISVGAVN